MGKIFNFKRPQLIALILVVLLVAVFSRLPSQTLGNLKMAIGGMFLPLFGLAGSSHHLVESTGNALVPRRELIRQNEELRKANQELRMQAQMDESIWLENARLRRLFAWEKQSRRKFKLAHVIARDPANWWRTLQIDVGSRDGIYPNLAVMTSEGLVGRIQLVGENRSQVLVLGDPTLRVAALVETNRERGIILTSSSNPQENGMVDLGFLSGNSQVRPGQNVLSSGEGGVFPSGIPIGRTVDLRIKDNGLSCEARVKLFANLGALEEVWVVLPTP